MHNTLMSCKKYYLFIFVAGFSYSNAMQESVASNPHHNELQRIMHSAQHLVNLPVEEVEPLRKKNFLMGILRNDKNLKASDFLEKKYPKRDIALHPLMNDGMLKVFHALAHKLSSIFDQIQAKINKPLVIMALGQSPAYLLEMIKLIDLCKKSNHRTYKHLAFSGSFFCEDIYGCRRDHEVENMYHQREHYYKNYLASLDISASLLSERKAHYILLEVCNDGFGLQSFLSLMNDYPIKPSIIYLQPSTFDSVKLIVPNLRIVLSQDERVVMNILANADEFEDRLVPCFPVYVWHTVDPLLFVPNENVFFLLIRLKNACSRCVSCLVALQETASIHNSSAMRPEFYDFGPILTPIRESPQLLIAKL